MKTTEKPAGSERISKLLAAGKRLAGKRRDLQVQNRQPTQALQEGNPQLEPQPGSGRPVNPRDLQGQNPLG